jgi:hypothetical protein
MELGKNMQNNAIAVPAEPMNRFAMAATKLLAGEVAGIPIALVACAVGAAILGGVVAITAGS